MKYIVTSNIPANLPVFCGQMSTFIVEDIARSQFSCFFQDRQKAEEFHVPVEHFACSVFVTDPHVSSTVTQTFLGHASVKIMKNGHEILVLSKQCWIWEESWASWDKFLYVFRKKNHKTVSSFHYLKHSLWQFLIQNIACPVTQVYVRRLGSIRGITKLSLREKIGVYMIHGGIWIGEDVVVLLIIMQVIPAASFLSVQVSAGTGRGFWLIEARREFLWEPQNCLGWKRTWRS